MVAYGFPPLGGSGVQRTLKFTKYLPDYGWQPYVVTVKDPPGQAEEEDQLLPEELSPQVRIYRTRSIEPAKIFRTLRARVKGIRRLSGVQSHAEGNESSPAAPSKLRWLKIFIDGLFIPDQQVGWLPFAVLECLRIIRREKIDAIYSTSEPFTDHLIAYVLKKISAKPWVADFRDPWTQYQRHPAYFRWRKRSDEWLERRFLSYADAVVITSDAAADNLVRKYPSLKRDKVFTITNGFDPADFDGLDEGKTGQKFTIVYTGRFNYPVSTSPNFLKALERLVSEEKGVKRNLEVIFVGVFGEENRRLVHELGLEEVTNLKGYLPHRESLAYLLRGDMLLLTLNSGIGGEVIYPAKVFEYLAAKRPILALVPEGVSAELVRSTKSGVVVDPDDVEEIKQAIRAAYHGYKGGTPTISPENCLSQYDRRELTKSLAEVLDRLTDEN